MASDGVKIYKAMCKELSEKITSDELQNNINVEDVRVLIDLLDEFNRFIDIEIRKTNINSDEAVALKRANNEYALRLDGILRAKNA